MWVYGWGELPGRLIVVSGPSGTGKSSLLRNLMNVPDLDSHQLQLSVSATTRAPRNGEQHGLDYFFFTQEQFQSAVDRGEFLEHAVYNGNMYGTPSHPVRDAMAKGATVILEIEVQGAMLVRERAPTAFFVFVDVPNFNDLERRLRARGTEDDFTIHQRLVQARRERDEAHRYDLRVINNELKEAVQEFVSKIILHKQ
jgi:guanylate kinase